MVSSVRKAMNASWERSAFQKISNAEITHIAQKCQNVEAMESVFYLNALIFVTYIAIFTVAFICIRWLKETSSIIFIAFS